MNLLRLNDTTITHTTITDTSSTVIILIVLFILHVHYYTILYVYYYFFFFLSGCFFVFCFSILIYYLCLRLWSNIMFNDFNN